MRFPISKLNMHFEKQHMGAFKKFSYAWKAQGRCSKFTSPFSLKSILNVAHFESNIGVDFKILL